MKDFKADFREFQNHLIVVEEKEVLVVSDALHEDGDCCSAPDSQ